MNLFWQKQGLQVRCALANAFIIIKPSSNAPQDFASSPHKADTIVKIVSLIDSREKNGRLDSKLFFIHNPVQKWWSNWSHKDSKHLCFSDSGSWSSLILDLAEFARWLRKYWHDCKEFATDWFQDETQYWPHVYNQTVNSLLSSPTDLTSVQASPFQ